MAETLTLYGQVKDQGDDLPLPGILVEVHEQDPEGDHKVAGAITDANGYFELSFRDGNLLTELEDAKLYFRLYDEDQLIHDTKAASLAFRSDLTWRFDFAMNLSGEGAGTDFSIHGRLLQADGSPIIGYLVRAYDLGLVDEVLIGEASSVEQGKYSIEYTRADLSHPAKKRADLILRVYRSSRETEHEIQTPLILSAQAIEQINLVVSDEPYTGPTEYSLLEEKMEPLLQGLEGLEDLAVFDEKSALMLARQSGLPPMYIAWYLKARRIAENTAVPAEVLYGFFRVQESMDLSRLITRERDSIRQSLAAAARANLISPTWEWQDEAVLNGLNVKRIQLALGEGRASMQPLLTMAGLSEDQQNSFLEDFLRYEGSLPYFWLEIRDDYSPGVARALQNLIRFAAITRKHYPLMMALFQEAGIRKPRELAAYQEEDWREWIDREDIGFVDGFPGSYPEEQREDYARLLTEITANAYPTASVAARLTRDKEWSDGDFKIFFRNNPAYEFKRASIPKWVEDKEDALEGINDPEAFVKRAEAFRRLFFIVPGSHKYPVLKALMNGGHHSAARILGMGFGPFVQRYEGEMGRERAEAVWRKAEELHLPEQNPALRAGQASSFLQELQRKGRAADLNPSWAEQNFNQYLYQLEDVGRLEIMAALQDESRDILHVFGRTPARPYRFYQRDLEGGASWSPWKPLPLSGNQQYLLPSLYRDRLYLFLPQLIQEDKGDWVSLSWREFQDGGWSESRELDARIKLDTYGLPVSPGDLVFHCWEGEEALYICVSLYREKRSQNEGEAGADRFPVLDQLHTLKKAFRLHQGQASVTEEHFLERVAVGGSLVRPSGSRPHGQKFMLRYGRLELPASLEYGTETRKASSLAVDSAKALLVRDLEESGTLVFASGGLDRRCLNAAFYEGPDRTWFVRRSDRGKGPLWERFKAGNVDLSLLDRVEQLFYKPLLEDLERPSIDRSGPKRQVFKAKLYPGNYFQDGQEDEILDRGADEAPEKLFSLSMDAVEQSLSDLEAPQNYFQANDLHSFHFETFYHPGVARFIQAKNKYGVPGFLRMGELLTEVAAPDYFEQEYRPADLLKRPFPRELIDFDLRSPYGLYNWELFFLVPLQIAEDLSANGWFEAAEEWFRVFFDPSGMPPWIFRPLAEVQWKAALEQVWDLCESGLEPLEDLDSEPRNAIYSDIRSLGFMQKALAAYTHHLLNRIEAISRAGDEDNTRETLLGQARTLLGSSGAHLDNTAGAFARNWLQAERALPSSSTVLGRVLNQLLGIRNPLEALLQRLNELEKTPLNETN